MGRRLGWIEAARTLACGLVVLAHVNIYIRAGLETWWPGGFAVVPFLALAVPTFLAIAGYVADLGLTSHATSARWLGSRLRRLLPPFFAWNLLTLLVLMFIGERPNAWQVAQQLTTGTWHLYFLFALVQLLVLHTLLRHLLSTHLPLLLALAVGGTIAMYALSEAVLWILGPDGGEFEMHARKTFLMWGGFYALGVWWCRRPPVLRNPGLAVVLAGLTLIAYAGYIVDLRLEDQIFGHTPRKQLLLGGLLFQFLGAITVMVCMQQWERSGRSRRLLQAIGTPGAETFGIYLSHIAVLALLWMGWELAGAVSMGWYEVPLFTVATGLTSLVLVRAVRALKNPWLSRLLLGEQIRASPITVSSASAQTGMPIARA